MRRRFSYVTIDPSEDWLGSVCGHKVSKCFRPDVDGWGGTRSVAERILMVLVAGDVAESRLERRQSRPGSSDDLVKAFELASRICGSDEEVEAYLNWLYIRIGCLLEIEYHWKAVEAVAAALLTRKRIGYRKARSIVKNAIET